MKLTLFQLRHISWGVLSLSLLLFPQKVEPNFIPRSSGDRAYPCFENLSAIDGWRIRWHLVAHRKPVEVALEKLIRRRQLTFEQAEAFATGRLSIDSLLDEVGSQFRHLSLIQERGEVRHLEQLSRYIDSEYTFEGSPLHLRSSREARSTLVQRVPDESVDFSQITGLAHQYFAEMDEEVGRAFLFTLTDSAEKWALDALIAIIKRNMGSTELREVLVRKPRILEQVGLEDHELVQQLRMTLTERR